MTDSRRGDQIAADHGIAKETGMETSRSRVAVIDEARSNDAFRRVLITGIYEQVVVMAIPPGGEIGDEVHPETDQVLVFVEGEAEARLDGEITRVGGNDLVYVRAGTRHNFVNTGPSPLRLYTIYAPPHHPPGTVHQTKADADAAD
jgi:mannose-6-phosphate isomerase-like protein (cupin superfamily)